MVLYWCGIGFTVSIVWYFMCWFCGSDIDGEVVLWVVVGTVLGGFTLMLGVLIIIFLAICSIACLPTIMKGRKC